MEDTFYPPVVLTGDRPTGPLHLGHLVGSMRNRVQLQTDIQFDRAPDVPPGRFYMVADVQALTDNFATPTKVRDNVRQVVLDNLAVGLDPAQTNIFIQSMIPEIAELTVFFMNLVTVAEVGRNPTVKTEIAQKEFGESVPLGFFCYPVSQAADILFARATHIPVGEDQLLVIELAREIARSFNRTYHTELFPEPQGVLSTTPRLVGIDGQAKASKSLGNAIFLSDDTDTVAQKVRGMFTCPSKLHVGDSVTDEELAGNVVFQYLDVFDTDSAQVAQLRVQYQQGQIGDVMVKERLLVVLEELLRPIRARRAEFADHPEAVDQIIRDGVAIARSVAADTMRQVREAMLIQYF